MKLKSKLFTIAGLFLVFILVVGNVPQVRRIMNPIFGGTTLFRSGEVVNAADGTLNLASGDGLTVPGTLTATSGVTIASATSVISAVGGPVVSATAPGTDTACSDGDRYWTEIQIPSNVTLTGIWYLVGSVGGTDSVVVDLYSSAGVLVASSDSLASQEAFIVGTAAQVQKVVFNGTYAAVAGKYFISVQFNGTTAKFRSYGVTGSPFIAATAAGTFRTAAAITPGTTFTADEGPVSGVY